MAFKVPERWRHQHVTRPSKVGDLNGCFLVPAKLGEARVPLRCIASCGENWDDSIGPVPWEHVSVSPQPPIRRTPTWAEMCFVKDLFWDAEDAVMQLHPPHSEYVNHAPYCLHLWRPVGVELVRPPSMCVGAVMRPDGGDAGRPANQHEVCREHPGGCIMIEKDGRPCIRGDVCGVIYASPPDG